MIMILKYHRELFGALLGVLLLSLLLLPSSAGSIAKTDHNLKTPICNNNHHLSSTNRHMFKETVPPITLTTTWTLLMPTPLTPMVLATVSQYTTIKIYSTLTTMSLYQWLAIDNWTNQTVETHDKDISYLYNIKQKKQQRSL